MDSLEAGGSRDGAAGKTAAGSSGARNLLFLFLASFVALFFELTIIRFISTEIRIFAYLKNVALIASFFGIGLGMILESPPKSLKKLFPLIAAALLLLITFSAFLRLTHLPIPTFDYRMFVDQPNAPTGDWYIPWVILMFLIYLIVVPAIMYLIVAFFAVLGGLVGEHLKQFPSLKGYGVNLAGSLAGILAFTALSFLGSPPVIWVLLGFLTLIPFFLRERWTLVAFALIVGAMAIPQTHVYWSPYYRITLEPVPPPPGWTEPAAYQIVVNYDFFQRIVDLTPEFAARYPDAQPNKTWRPHYEIPYRLAPHPARVLVVGAGTGNDVAAALRHGVDHVDAVEIDPFLIRIGRKYHPEHPYDSPKVTVYVDDARAFFKKTHEKYDLIIFGYLDAHTMLTGLSSIRLDNYVYTVESFREARGLLNENGTLVMAFTGGSFMSERLFATLAQAFDTPPRAYFTGYNQSGVVYVEGKGAESNAIGDYPEITKQLEAARATTLIATDHWPFLYLQSRTIPFAIWSVVALFLYFAWAVLKKQVPMTVLASRQGLHLFFLGAGFMLLETKGVTELSLLFGSTWTVNAVVIAAFLTMGLLANSVIMVQPVSRRVAYTALFIVLAASVFLPYSIFEGLPGTARVMASATLAGLPVFFSGLIFSRSFRDVAKPSQGLGINLLGAVVGGVLENLVMVGGTPILGVLAFILYGLSAAFVPRGSGQDQSAGLPADKAEPASAG